MTSIANLFVGLVGFLHVCFLVYEMFFWGKSFEPWQLEVEHKKCATASKRLAANQGLYNGFLAAGLFWGLSSGTAGTSIKIFFLSCVVVAGVFGGVTIKRAILFAQAIPGAVALALVLLRL